MSYILKKSGIGVVARTYDTRTTALVAHAVKQEQPHAVLSVYGSKPGGKFVRIREDMDVDDIQTEVAGL